MKVKILKDMMYSSQWEEKGLSISGRECSDDVGYYCSCDADFVKDRISE